MTDLQMQDVHSRNLTAFFDTRESADHAVADLVQDGIPREHVTVTGGANATSTATATTDDKGFWESLKDMFLPEDERHVYSEGLRRGGYVVSVRADEANYTRVLDILDRDGAVDLDQREATWRSEGWTGSAVNETTAGAMTAAPVALASTTKPVVVAPVSTAPIMPLAATKVGTDEVIPLYEETLRVGKRDVNQGRVRVRSYVVSTPVTEQVSLHSENVEVVRSAVDRPVTATDAMFQDRVIEAEEHVEEAVIAKDARVKEEITLRKTASDRSQTVTDSVRHTEVEVTDERGVTTGTAKGFMATDTSAIVAHMDVIASDGTKIGTVDHMDGPDKIKLAKTTSPDGEHHFIPLAWVDHVDAHVHLNKTSEAAKLAW